MPLGRFLHTFFIASTSSATPNAIFEVATKPHLNRMTATRDLQEAALVENYSRWREQLVGPMQFGSDQFLKALATHTFPALKAWNSTAPEQLAVYESILFRDRALLSDKTRELEARFSTEEHRRRGLQWREAGLDSWVSAYIGVHDPYYSLGEDVPMPAFGLFFASDAESLEVCLATRRDLASPEADEVLEHNFLTPAQTRELLRCETCIIDHHQGDFWHYWGSPQYWHSDLGYGPGMWKWKHELHFYDRLSLANIDAVLWPSIVGANPTDEGREYSAVTTAGEQFRAQWPRISVLYYDWSPVDPNRDFMEASYIVAKYAMTFGVYPPSLTDARAILNE